MQQPLVSPDSSESPPSLRSYRGDRISDIELAPRLSFFIWSSVPDDELIDLPQRQLKIAAARPTGQRCSPTMTGAVTANLPYNGFS